MDYKHAIAAPESPEEYSRTVQCEEALEPGLQALIEDVGAAGWSDEEIGEAMLGLVVRHLGIRGSQPARSDGRSSGFSRDFL